MRCLALKVDVDTYEGFRDGVPRLLDCLGRRGRRASFFVSMGPDRSGRAVLRAFRQRGFVRKMLRSNALRLYGLRTALSGTLLPARPIARSHPEILRRVLAEGHELGIHGYDHVAWHDGLLGFDEAQAASHVERALAIYRELVGGDPSGFAAPGWQCSRESIAVLDRGPFVYHSCTRGERPYRPRAGAVEGRIPELPTTLPTLDELLGLGTGEREALALWQRSIGGRDWNVLTIHAEVEGRAFLGLFDDLLDGLGEAVLVKPLVDVARDLDPRSLPVCEVVQATRPGRAGTVSCQRS